MRTIKTYSKRAPFYNAFIRRWVHKLAAHDSFLMPLCLPLGEDYTFHIAACPRTSHMNVYAAIVSLPDSLGLLAVVLCLVGGGLGNLMHFWIKFRLSSAGLPVKWLMGWGDVSRMHETYRKEAPLRGWPLWPLDAYNAGLVLFIAFGVPALLYSSKHEEIFSTTDQWLQRRGNWVIVWLYLVCSAQALIFTLRVLRKTPRRSDGRIEWTAMMKNEYLRSDLYLATMGWGGIVFIYLASAMILSLVKSLH